MAREVNEQEYRLIDRVTAGFNTIAAGLGKLKTGMTELNQTAELASKGLNLVVGAARGLGDQVKGVADYETAMTRIIERTQATREEQDLLAQAVQNAQRELGVTAAVSADALLRMVKDGFSAREAADALGTSLAYAKAEGVDAAQAIDGLGGVLDSFNEKPQIIGQLADQLTAASRAAGTSTEALAEGLSGVGIAAQESNVSLDQTLAYLALLAKRNIEGAAATKQLVTIMGDFRDPASAAGKALEDLGLKGQGFDQIITALASNSSQAATVLQTLGDKPRAALQALLADGGGALKELNTIIGASEGSAKSAADALKGTFNDSLDRVIASVDRAKIALGAPILAPLADGLQDLADKLNKAAESGAFDEIGKKLAEFVANGVPKIVEFLTAFDFEAAAKNVAEFVDASIVLFNALAATVKVTAAAIGTVYEAVSFGTSALSEYDARVQGIAAATEAAGIPVDTLVQLLNDVGVGARALSDESLAALQQRFGLTAEQARQLQADAREVAAALPEIGKSAKDTTDDIESFGQGVLKLADRLSRITVGQAGVKALADAARKLGLAFKEIPAPAKLLEGSFTSLEEALQAQIEKLEEARKAYNKAFDAGTGGADAAWEAVKRAGSSVADLRRQLDAARSTTVGLTDAFKELGFQSQAALQETAQKGSAAFDAIAAAAKRGEAAQSDVTRAFEEYARRLAATGELADQSTRAQIAQQIELKGRIAGVSEELIRASTEGLRAGSDIASAGDDAARSWTAVKTEAKESARSFREAADSAEESGRRTAEAAERAATAMQAQRSIQIELTDGWREQAEAIGVNVEAVDRMVKNAEIATDRLLGLSRRRKAAQEAEAKAAKESAQATEPAAQQPAGAAGGLGNGPRPTGTQSNGGSTQQPAQAGGITQIFQIQGAWSQDNVNELAALLERRARLAR